MYTNLTSPWMTVVVAVSSALAAVLVGELAALVVRRLGRRHAILSSLAQRGRRPLALFLATIAVWVSTKYYASTASWQEPTFLVLRLLAVVFGAWLAVVAANTAQDVLLHRYRIDVEDNRRARQRVTQVSLLKRIVVAVVVVVAVGSLLLNVPGAEGVGTSVLASAGLISVVAGLAAQTSLANVFAGLQIAFTDGIRIDDVVVVEKEWGHIEDITLTYVVVRIWDQRRLILPSTYFTTTPFENWTRNTSDIIGSVEFDVDWSVPFDALREHIEAFVTRHPLWNGKAFTLQVTDAVNSVVRFRVLVSADGGGQLFDLRCAVREELIGLLQREHPEALPQVRMSAPGQPLPPPEAPGTGRDDTTGRPVL